MRLPNPIQYFENGVKDLPPHVRAAFVELGETQRGAPEDAMSEAQRALGGGELSWAVEHVGDLVHRMTHMLAWKAHPNAGYEYVGNKVDKILRALRQPYEFARKHTANMKSNARYHGVSLEQYVEKANEALAEYARQHASLPAYNRAHWLARQAAVALGKQDFGTARFALEGLETKLNSEEEWEQFATEYRLDASGQLLQYPW